MNARQCVALFTITTGRSHWVTVYLSQRFSHSWKDPHIRMGGVAVAHPASGMSAGDMSCNHGRTPPPPMDKHPSNLWWRVGGVCVCVGGLPGVSSWTYGWGYICLMVIMEVNITVRQVEPSQTVLGSSTRHTGPAVEVSGELPTMGQLHLVSAPLSIFLGGRGAEQRCFLFLSWKEVTAHKVFSFSVYMKIWISILNPPKTSLRFPWSTVQVCKIKGFLLKCRHEPNSATKTCWNPRR